MSTLNDFKKLIDKDPFSAPIMTIEFFKKDGGVTYSYRFKKGPGFKDIQLADDFMLYCLMQTVKDIVEFNDDPTDVLDHINTIIDSLGYERGD